MISFSISSQLTPRSSSVSSREQSVDDLTGLMSKLKTQESKGKEAAGLQPRNSALPSGDAERMIHTNADLHLFDQQSNAFVPKVENTNVLIVKIGAYKCKYSCSKCV
jgi:hypothetical protein